jgi:hypothetical protein
MDRTPFLFMIAPSRANRTERAPMSIPAAGPPSADAKHEEPGVVLLAPEVLDNLDDDVVLARLLKPLAAARVLLCLTDKHDKSGVPLANALAHANIQTEILIAAGMEKPDTGAFVLPAPPGTSQAQQIEFALALSDTVVVAPGFEQTILHRLARELGKPVIPPGAAPPPVPALAEITRRLDPDLVGWHARGRGLFGRIEQGAIELLAFNWKGRAHGGMAASRRRLWKCLHPSWRPGPYFAPDAWRKLAPDLRARTADGALARCFDALDRSAVYGSYIHRDLIWISYLGAAFAVLAAVKGHLSHHAGIGWGITELATLALVALLVLVVRKANLQDRWTACRFGAEQLRIARMSLPLLVLPSALATSDAPAAAEGESNPETALGFKALAVVKRAVRDQGLPRLDPACTPVDAAKWVRLIVGNQIEYHHDNHHKLEHAERRLRLVTQFFFYVAVVAVIAQFKWDHAEWLLLFTAAGPAFAAAVHGIATRLGIVHRAALSIATEMELKEVDSGLDKIDDSSRGEDGWREVRRLTVEAGEAMGRENTSWHGLVRRYRDELP